MKTRKLRRHPDRTIRFETLERREVLASAVFDIPLVDPPVDDQHDVLIDHVAQGEQGNTISDSGGFEGSQMQLKLAGNGGGTIDYQYEHFSIPDNFIIRYEGKNLFETGFTGGRRSGTVQVPTGNSDFVEIIVATNDSGTAWNYTATANSCGNPEPFDLSVVGGEFESAKDPAGKDICKATGTVLVGRTDGIAQMLRIENATAEYNDSSMKIAGEVYSLIGEGEVLTKPIFTGSFEIPFKTGNSSAFTDAKTNGTSEYRFGGLDIDFSNISLNRNTISLGVNFELSEELGLPEYAFSGSDGLIISQNSVSLGPSVKFSLPNFKDFNLFGYVPIAEFSNFAIEYIAAQDTIKIQGKLVVELPSKSPVDKVTVDLSGMNFIQIKGGEPDIIGELIAETDLTFPPRGWGLTELKLKLDTINKDVVGGAKITLPFKSKVDVAGELGFKLPIPPLEINRLALDVDNLNIAIPAYPMVFFQGFRGSFENFASSDTDPVEFNGGISATLGPQVNIPDFGRTSLARLDLDVKLTSEELMGTGTITIINAKILTGNVSGNLNWDKKFFKAAGGINVLDGLFDGSGSFQVTSNFDVNFGATGKIGIPNEVPLFGGYQVANGNLLFDFSNNGNSSDDFGAVWGVVNFEKLGFEARIVVGAKKFFDGRVERIGAKNIPPIGSFDIPANTPWFLMGADWETETNADVPLVVIKPDGTRIAEADFEANDIFVVDELTDTTSKSVIVFGAEAGIWDLEVADPTGLGAVTYAAAENAIAPTVQLVTPAQNVSGGNVLIEYTATDADSDAEVTLFYDDDASGMDGVPIVRGLAETDGNGSFVWDTQGIATGDYYVYAMVSDGDNAPVYSYSTGVVEITEAADLAVTQQLVTPTNVEVDDAFTVAYVVSNNGPDAAANVSEVISLPANAVFVSSSVTPSSTDGSNLTFDIGSLASGANATIEVVMNAPGTPETLRTQSQISADTYDPDASNDANELAILVNAEPVLLPDLSVTLASTLAPVDVNQPYLYELTIENNGVGNATNVVVSEQLPANVSYVRTDVTQGTASFDSNNRFVTVSLGDLAPGERATVGFVTEASAAGSLISTTVVSSDEDDADTTDNFLITVNAANALPPAAADLALSITSDATNPKSGDRVQIDLTISNEGPGVASGIQVLVPLPPQLQFVSAVEGQGTYDPVTGIWNVGNIRDNLSRTLSIVATVVGTGAITNTAEITAVSESDPDSTPNNGDTSEDDFSSVSMNLGPDTRILVPNLVTRPHVIPGDGATTAILFRANVDTQVTVVPIGTVSFLQQVRMLDRDLNPMGDYVDGLFTAALTSEGLYALIFDGQSSDQLFSIHSSAGFGSISGDSPTNLLQPTDVNGSGQTTLVDALAVMSRLDVLASVSGESSSVPSGFFYDVSGDGNVTPMDLLQILNYLNEKHLDIGSAQSELFKSDVRDEDSTETSTLAPSVIDRVYKIGSFATIAQRTSLPVSIDTTDSIPSDAADRTDQAISELTGNLQ
ncbi:MAG: DUF11 domain-containing protein [Pirellulaceae bacterium]|nr:DUF11 domain-containing protein [Pirellulaceae bacterium]